MYSAVWKDSGGEVKRVELNLLSTSLVLLPVAAATWWDEAAAIFFCLVLFFFFHTTQKSCLLQSVQFFSLQKHCLIVGSSLWPSCTCGLTRSCSFGRFISCSTESSWSWGGAADLWCFRRGRHALFFCQQRHRCCLASTATRQGGTTLTIFVFACLAYWSN